MSGNILDLHGCYHSDVEYEVERFLILNDPPFEIITGNSSKMQEIVCNVLNRYNLEAFYRNPNNLGSLVVMEKSDEKIPK